MFTQCSKCETIFKLSAEVLRAAGGQVRCGKCGEVFNALARLAEDANTFTSSETEFELESRADSILESPVPGTPRRAPDPGEDSLPPGVEVARLQILDWSEDELPAAPAAVRTETRAAGGDEDAADTRPDDSGEDEVGENSLEFTLPPGELDRIFVESKTPRRPLPQDLSVDIDLGEPAADPGEMAEVDADEVGEIPAPRASGFEVPEDVRREMLMGMDPAETLAPRSALADRRFIRWLAASIAAALLLARTDRAPQSRMACRARSLRHESRCAVRSAGRPRCAAAESFCVSAQTMGRHRRSGRGRHLAGAGQHHEYRGAA